MALLKINVILILVFCFLSHQVLSPKIGYGSSNPICPEYADAHIREIFGNKQTCTFQAKTAIKNLLLTDELPEYAGKYYHQLSLNLNAVNIFNIKEYCQTLRKVKERDVCYDSVKSIFQNSGFKNFDEKNRLQCLLAAFHYMRLKDVEESNEIHYINYYKHLHDNVEVTTKIATNSPGLAPPSMFCDKIAKEKTKVDRKRKKPATAFNDPNTELHL